MSIKKLPNNNFKTTRLLDTILDSGISRFRVLGAGAIILPRNYTFTELIPLGPIPGIGF